MDIVKILYINMLDFCFRLFGCLSELIEELASRKYMKIGMWLSNDESTIKLEDQNEFFTPLKN